MLKVLHTGDWHIGSFPGPEVGGQNARFQDICRCLDFQAMYAEEHRPDLIVVSGDIFHQARVWSDRGLRESRTAIDHIRRLSNLAPTVVLRGTPNHDSEEQFEMLTTAFYGDDSVSVVTEPEVLHIHTYHGQRVDVACIPGFDRGVHRAAHPGLSREEETQVFTDELAKVVLGLKAQCEPGVTSILSTHFTVPGCNMESGQTALFAQFEPVIYPDTLKAADFDLVALGHIHRPQQLPEAGRAVFYCGSITGLNFNDEGQPRGFYIHDIDDDGETWSEYVETPYREFETIRLGEDDVRAMLSAERVVVPDRLKGKIVRVLYTCSDETNKAFNKAVLEKRLYDGGVFYVSEITPEEITTSVNRDELHGDNSPEQNLAEYLAEKEKSPEDAQRIIELARPIISEAMEKGRLETPTGVFMPVEIEVKNYRNYRDELFSYDGISFATINGENGAGKSSLFMRPSRGPRKGSRGHSQRGAGADYGHHQQALRLRRTEMARNSVCKTAILFVFGGLVYFGLEVLFRGHSHWTMFVLGGFLFLILGELNEGLLEWDTPLIWQGVLGSAIVTGAELATGMILNVWLGLGVWDYSGMLLNYKGQICLPFSILWIFVSIAAVVLDDWLRYWLFGEERPHYTLFRRGESR